MAPADYVMVKSEARMKEALAVVDTAETMLDQMSANDYHELSKCVDARSMVIGARLFYTASLERKESRGFHKREDYPERNDDEWLKWIIIQKKDEGMEISYEPIPFGQYKYEPAK